MKVKIELEPYNALQLLAFLREFINDDNSDEYKFRAIHESVNEYESEIRKKVTNEQMDEVNAVNQINQLIGKSPKR